VDEEERAVKHVTASACDGAEALSRGPSVDSRLDRLAREGERGRDDGEDPGGPPGEDGVPDAGGVGAARAVLDGMARASR